MKMITSDCDLEPQNNNSGYKTDLIQVSLRPYHVQCNNSLGIIFSDNTKKSPKH